jgi:hypothetical protein
MREVLTASDDVVSGDTMMKKLALIAGAGLLALGSAGSAQAQRFNDGGWDDDGWGPSRRAVQERIVGRRAPMIRQRVMYERPRARVIYSQPAYSTRVTLREPRRERVRERLIVRRTLRDDFDGDRRERRMERRMMGDW